MGELTACEVAAEVEAGDADGADPADSVHDGTDGAGDGLTAEEGVLAAKSLEVLMQRSNEGVLKDEFADGAVVDETVAGAAAVDAAAAAAAAAVDAAAAAVVVAAAAAAVAGATVAVAAEGDAPADAVGVANRS